jgi:ferritin
MTDFHRALNEQIASELAASNQYLAIAVYYDAQTLPTLAAHFYRQALEERNHGMMMVQYLLDSDAEVTVPAIAEPQNRFVDERQPVELALAQERHVTEQIAQLVRLAQNESDFVGAQFLGWFLEEQREEVASMSALLAVIDRATTSNLLLVEDYLVRSAGVTAPEPTSTAPPAAGGAV